MGKKLSIAEHCESGEKEMRKRLVEVLAAIAFADITDVAQIRSNGEAQIIEHVDSSELSRELRLAIKTIKMTREGIVIELYDKMKALELLGKYFGVFQGNTEGETLITITPQERAVLKKYEKRMMEKRNSQKIAE